MKPLFLFVRPPRPLWPFNGPSTAFWPPLAFASLAAALREEESGVRVAILDAPALAMGWKTLGRQMRALQPCYIGIGEEAVSCAEGLRIARLWSHEIRRHFATWWASLSWLAKRSFSPGGANCSLTLIVFPSLLMTCCRSRDTAIAVRITGAWLRSSLGGDARTAANFAFSGDKWDASRVGMLQRVTW